MNNLRIVGLKVLELPNQTCSTDKHSFFSNQAPSYIDVCAVPSLESSSLSYSQDPNDYVVLCSNGEILRFHTNGELKWVHQLASKVIESDGSSGWFLLSRLDSDSLIVLSRNGAIVRVALSNGEAELVGEFEFGILAGRWSPDGEVLALVTSVNDESIYQRNDENPIIPKRFVLLSMNTNMDVLNEVNLETCDPNKTISICWRPDALLLAVSSVDASDQKRKIRVFHRDTLSLHAVGRTEDGTGTLAPNLRSPMSWAGSNCSFFLTTIQFKGKKQQVAFLEPNGLRHGQFLLRSDSADYEACCVTQITWNMNSDLLAIHLQDALPESLSSSSSSTSESYSDRVQLWHRCNYHWYLVQEFRTRSVDAVRFQPEDPYTLLLLQKKCLRVYRVCWDPSNINDSSLTTAFVVDGSVLHITHLQQSVIPPPMSAVSLSLSHSIVQVIAISHGRTSDPPYKSVFALAVHSNTNISWIESGVESKDAYHITRVTEWTGLNSDLDPTSFRSYCLVGGSIDIAILLAVAPSSSASGATIQETLLTLHLSRTQVIVIEKIPLNGRVLTVTAWSDVNDGALIQMEDGQLLEFEYPASVHPSEAEPLLEPCAWISALKHVPLWDVNTAQIDDDSKQQHLHRTRLVVGLSARNRLYCHDLLLSDAVSSFQLSLSHEYLCYATSGSRCELRLLPLVSLYNFDPYSGSEENQICQLYDPRLVERGARIVAILSLNPAVIVQMPRGNLETVFPRPLVLRHTVRLMDKGNYKAAFVMLRRHRVDLNLIVDLDPIRFLDGGGVEKFLEQVFAIDHLNLFVSCLQDVDSTQGGQLVPNWWRCCDASSTHGKNVANFDFASKVNRICQTLRSFMLRANADKMTSKGRPLGEGHYLLPILSTYAKQNPPQLDEALRMIKETALVKYPSGVSTTKFPLFSDATQRAIQYLAYLAEHELLFETALSMYEFDVARAVARNSQMDPKVYLPLLKRFRKLPKNFARYEVDIRQQRYDSALRHLFKSSELNESVAPEVTENIQYSNGFDACIRLIEEKHLFKLGLNLFQDEVYRSNIMISLGDYLLCDKRDPASALSIFLSCPRVDLQRATLAARHCRDWRTFFALSDALSQESISDEVVLHHRRNLLARDVADEIIASAHGRLEKRKLLIDAARILLDYGTKDITAAVDVLIQAEWWNEGKRVAQLNGRQDLIRKCTDAAVAYAHTAHIDLEERQETFVSSLKAYSESLKIRKDAVTAGIDEELGLSGEIEGQGDIDETGSFFSLASDASVSSTASRSSTGSVSSAYSVSSVISVKTTTTFAVTGSDERNRHKSKYNTVGDRRSKNPSKIKNRRKGGRSKVRPGSDQELQGFLQTLQSCCVDEDYCLLLTDTITYLIRNGHVALSKSLHDACIEVNTAIYAALNDLRIHEQQHPMQVDGRYCDGTGSRHSSFVLPIEEEVTRLKSCSLSDDFTRIFSFLPD